MEVVSCRSWNVQPSNIRNGACPWEMSSESDIIHSEISGIERGEEEHLVPSPWFSKCHASACRNTATGPIVEKKRIASNKRDVWR